MDLRRRAGIIFVVAAVTVGLLCGCSTGVTRGIGRPSHHVQTDVSNAARIASCTDEQVHPFTCDSFTVQYPSGDPSSFQSWFDVADGGPRLLVGESEHIRVLPVRLDAEGATADPVAGWKPLQRTCFPDGECALDRLVERVFTSHVRITIDGSRLRLASDSAVLLASDTGRPHRYAQVGSATAGDTTLLTYRDDGMHMAAANSGRLSVNAAGCLTDGSSVLVLPDTTTLDADGSIDIAGRHVPIGGTLDLGGGEGPVPADQRCGTGGYWYGYGD